MTALVSISLAAGYIGCSESDAILTKVHPAVLAYLDRATRRTLASTAYKHRLYDGRGNPVLHLDDWPITTIDRISIGTRSAMTITNTSADASVAKLEIDATNLKLTVTGGVNLHAEHALALGAYTFATLITEIGTWAHGWSATIASADYNNFPATDLMPKYGANALDVDIDVQQPEDPEQYFDVRADDGTVVALYGIWPRGRSNIVASLTAGYTTCPDDLALLIYMACKECYRRIKDDEEHLKSYSLGNINITLQEFMGQAFAREILKSYKRILL